MTTPTPDRVTQHLDCVPQRFQVMPEYQGIIQLARELQSDLAAAQEALQDCAAGLLYIRQMHGELYGVAFDRALSKADAAYPEWRAQK